MFKLPNLIDSVKSQLWDSFVDSSAEILKQVQVLTASKIKDGGRKPSYELMSRTGDLIRDVQGEITTQRWGMESDSLGGAGQSVESKRTLNSRQAYLITKSIQEKWLLSNEQKQFFKYLGYKARKDYGRNDALSIMYLNMGYTKRASYLYSRPYIDEALKEVNWVDTVKRNIEKRVQNKVVRVVIG